MRKKIINLANAVTLFRLLLGFYVIYLVYLKRSLALFLFIVFFLMDILDGYLAKKFYCQTLFGKNFDLMTDGIVGWTVGILLFIQGIIPLLFVLILIPALLIWVCGLVRGIIKKGNTFVHGKWKNFEGVLYYGGILMFLINQNWALIIAYLIVGLFYVDAIKYNLEITLI